MKPESVGMRDVILEDTESEVRNEFVVFEIKGEDGKIQFEFRRKIFSFVSGSQGNYWIEGGGFMKTVNESFQV
jgi:hypothetical protein